MTVKDFAEKQWFEFGETGECDEMVGVEYNGQFIINPWVDPSGRFELTDEEAEKTYGIAVLQQFAIAANMKMEEM